MPHRVECFLDVEERNWQVSRWLVERSVRHVMEEEDGVMCVAAVAEAKLEGVEEVVVVEVVVNPMEDETLEHARNHRSDGDQSIRIAESAIFALALEQRRAARKPPVGAHMA